MTLEKISYPYRRRKTATPPQLRWGGNEQSGIPPPCADQFGDRRYVRHAGHRMAGAPDVLPAFGLGLVAFAALMSLAISMAPRIGRSSGSSPAAAIEGLACWSRGR